MQNSKIHDIIIICNSVQHSRVIKELEQFTHGDCTPEEKEDETTKAQKMWRRDPQNELQRESVQFGHQKLQQPTNRNMQSSNYIHEFNYVLIR